MRAAAPAAPARPRYAAAPRLPSVINICSAHWAARGGALSPASGLMEPATGAWCVAVLGVCGRSRGASWPRAPVFPSPHAPSGVPFPASHHVLLQAVHVGCVWLVCGGRGGRTCVQWAATCRVRVVGAQAVVGWVFEKWAPHFLWPPYPSLCSAGSVTPALACEAAWCFCGTVWHVWWWALSAFI